MARRPNIEELARARDRRRRRADALRLVPLLGALLFVLPLLMSTGAGWSTATIGLYLFWVWAGLIVLVGWLSRRSGLALGDEPSGERSAEPPEGKRGP